MLHLKREGALGVGRDEQAAWEAAVLPLNYARKLLICVRILIRRLDFPCLIPVNFGPCHDLTPRS